jgi:hypothetical protein
VHGSRTIHPLKIAQCRFGFGVDGGSSSFYSRGIYFAHNARYSHHYAYTSSDLEGNFPAEGGAFHHLIVASVLRGRFKSQPDAWTEWEKKNKNAGILALGDSFDSVQGGPHMPGRRNGSVRPLSWKDRSLMTVVYHTPQALAEFIVTYKVRCRGERYQECRPM